jgi:hypothetical protein
MKQLDVPDEMKVDIDFSDKKLPKSAQIFTPLVFKDGDSYCCVLGPDAQQGVFGSGKTLAEALKEWNKNLEKKKKIDDPDDEVAFYIHETLKRNKEQVW